MCFSLKQNKEDKNGLQQIRPKMLSLMFRNVCVYQILMWLPFMMLSSRTLKPLNWSL